MDINDEILNALRGSYKTSFYSIYLNGTYNEDFTKMSQADQGTLVHEYIHFLQNISTPWGLYMSMTYYNLMFQSLHEIVANNPLYIPVLPEYSEQSKSSYKKLSATYGTKSIDKKKRIDWTKTVAVRLEMENVEGKDLEKAYLDIILADGTKDTIEIGAIIVNETMASLYQSLIDPSATHPEVPYNVVVNYCKRYYPELAQDTRKLICMCYASLFTLCPGAQLIRLIKDYGKADDMDGYSVFQQFIQNYYTGQKEDGTDKTVVDYMDELIPKFKNMLSAILESDLDFLDRIFEPVKLSSKWIPVVTALYDESPFSLDHFKTIVQHVGMPYLHTSTGQFSFPDAKNITDASKDLIELIAIQIIYKYFTTADTDKRECQLNYMCKGDKYEETRCKTHPWTQDVQCPFSTIAKGLEIDKKDIYIK